MGKQKSARKKTSTHSKLRSIIKHKYTPLVTIIGVAILFLASILVPVSVNEWSGETEVITYTTKRVGDSSLPIGQEQVKQAGKNGDETVVYQTRRNIWQVISAKLFGTTTSAERISSTGTLPTDEIISYGTKLTLPNSSASTNQTNNGSFYFPNITNNSGQNGSTYQQPSSGYEPVPLDTYTQPGRSIDSTPTRPKQPSYTCTYYQGSGVCSYY